MNLIAVETILHAERRQSAMLVHGQYTARICACVSYAGFVSDFLNFTPYSSFPFRSLCLFLPLPTVTSFALSYFLTPSLPESLSNENRGDVWWLL